MLRGPAATRKTIGVALMSVGMLWILVLQFRGGTVYARAEASGHISQNASKADIPQFQNAKVEARTLQGSLDEALHRWASSVAKAEWLGYSVPQVKGERTICCSGYNGHGGCGACLLEGKNSGINMRAPGADDEAGTVDLEGSREMAVLFRAEDGKIVKIRIFSVDCAADAGGLKVVWLEGVKASASVEVLQKFVSEARAESEYHDSVGKNALVALALHGDASADRALESRVAPDRPEWLRREAAFWLGEARGAEGLRALQRMARNDPSVRVREQVTFALSISGEPGALNEMIRMAHDDSSSQVRGQALFWLAQKAGKKAESAITGAIQDDPDTEVKKKAVFALTQMPKDEGVPKLIEVAQANKNPEVRKQAMFWLGQSGDPRALQFIERVLTQ